MDLEKILTIVGIVLGILTTSIIPLVIRLVKAIKDKKAAKIEAENAKTEAEKEAARAREEEAKNAIIEVIKQGVVEAEEIYKDFNDMLKSKGGTAGAVKKESVTTKVRAFAIDNGIKYDAEFVSKQIDNIVALTRSVNAD